MTIKIEMVPDENGIDIYQLRHDTCHWPLGAPLDHPPYRYCGAWTDHSSYCDTHRDIAYTTPRVKWV